MLELGMLLARLQVAEGLIWATDRLDISSKKDTHKICSLARARWQKPIPQHISWGTTHPIFLCIHTTLHVEPYYFACRVAPLSVYLTRRPHFSCRGNFIGRSSRNRVSNHPVCLFGRAWREQTIRQSCSNGEIIKMLLQHRRLRLVIT